MLLSSPTREGVTALQRKVLEVKGENPIRLVINRIARLRTRLRVFLRAQIVYIYICQ